MQSNRIIILLEEEKMEITFEQGIREIYKNSHLINEFVVRPKFKLGIAQTMWITFVKSGATLKNNPIMLAERQTTVVNSTKQVVDDGVSYIEQTKDAGCEYYLQLPDDLLVNDGVWQFSLEIREIPNSANPTAFTQIATSGVYTFVVNDSLAGANADGSTPTDLDVANLYKTAVGKVGEVEQSAADAATAATNAANSSGAADISAKAAANSEAEAKAAAEQSVASAESAKASEEAAITAANNAAQSEKNADDSAKAAAKSETNAGSSEAAAKRSETNAAESESAAKQSETSAEASAEFAKNAVKQIEQLIDGATEEITDQATAATKKAVEDETERATQAEGVLRESIEEEQSRAQTAEEGLQTAIDTEKNRALNAENDLNNAILSERSKIQKVESYIPTSTTVQNQLADKAFVNSSINAMAAFYITSDVAGNAFATKAALTGTVTFYSGGATRVPTQNDYAIVLSDESQSKGVDGSYPTTRYSYQGGTYPNGQWSFQYVVNNTSLTQAQVDAINSGITSTLVTKLNGIEAGAQKNLPVDTAMSASSTNPVQNKVIKAYVDDTVASAITVLLNTPV